MRIELDENVEDDSDEAIGAMIVPPLVGVVSKPVEDAIHYILLQLESDIKQQALDNLKKSPIEKNLMNHFKEVQAKAIQIQREKKKDEKK